MRYQLYLSLENVDHTKTKRPPLRVKSPQQKRYNNLEELQKDLDSWLEDYNRNRTHQGKYCFGKTPYQTFVDSAKLAWEKQLSDNFLFTQQTVR